MEIRSSAGKENGQNKVAVITGGGSGIGLAMARTFAASGYSVVITGRDAKRLQKAAANIPADKKQVTGIPCDVRDPASVETLFREIGKQYSTNRRADQQRWSSSFACAGRSALGRNVERSNRHEPDRHVPGHARRAAADACRRKHREQSFRRSVAAVCWHVSL